MIIPMIVLTMMGNLGFIQNLRPPMSYYVMTNYEYIYGVEYGEKFCEDYEVENQPYDCQHQPGLYTWYYFCGGVECTDHDDSTIPEDCTLESIENGQCRFGLYPP